MGADPNIFQAYLQPPKSIIDYQNQYAQADQLRNQNALSSLVLQQKGMEVGQAATAQNALQRIASGWNANTTPDQRVADLRNSGIPQLMTQADTLETQGLTRTKTMAEADKTKAETSTTQFNLTQQKREKAIQDIASFASPADAMASLSMHVQNGDLDPVRAHAMAQSIPQDPAAFQQWQLTTLKGLLSPKEGLEIAKPNVEFKPAGGSLVPVQTNAYAPGGVSQGTATGLAPIAITQSADNAATNATSRANNRDTINAETTRAGATLAETNRHNQATETGKAPMTEAQAKAYGFGTRMQEADRLLTQLAKDGAERPGNIKSALEATPLIGGGLGAATNWTQSPNQQSVEQAQRDFVNAVLRRESGAAINESEFVSARKQYFPQIGDSDQVKAQKAANRRLAIQGVMAEVPGGKGAAPAPAAAPNVLHFDANGNLVS